MLLTCAADFVVADSMMPVEIAAIIIWKFGSTMLIMMSNPPPSAPSMAAGGIITFSAVTGLDEFPRRPKPLNGAGMISPLVFAGTSQIVLAPSALIGLLDHT